MSEDTEKSARLKMYDEIKIWGAASRQGVNDRIDELVAGCITYVEVVGRRAEHLKDVTRVVEYKPLADLVEDAMRVLPIAVPRASRILWVDPEKLDYELRRALRETRDTVLDEVYRLQALYRRRSILWKHHPEKIEAIRADTRDPYLPKAEAKEVARGLIAIHMRIRPQDVLSERPRLTEPSGNGATIVESDRRCRLFSPSSVG